MVHVLVCEKLKLFQLSHFFRSWANCTQCSLSHQLLTRFQLAFISQEELGSYTKWKSNQFWLRIASFKRVTGYAHSQIYISVVPIDDQLYTYVLSIGHTFSHINQYSKLSMMCLKDVKDCLASCTGVTTHALASHRSSYTKMIFVESSTKSPTTTSNRLLLT